MLATVAAITSVICEGERHKNMNFVSWVSPGRPMGDPGRARSCFASCQETFIFVSLREGFCMPVLYVIAVSL